MVGQVSWGLCGSKWRNSCVTPRGCCTVWAVDDGICAPGAGLRADKTSFAWNAERTTEGQRGCMQGVDEPWNAKHGSSTLRASPVRKLASNSNPTLEGSRSILRRCGTGSPLRALGHIDEVPETHV